MDLGCCGGPSISTHGNARSEEPLRSIERIHKTKGSMGGVREARRVTARRDSARPGHTAHAPLGQRNQAAARRFEREFSRTFPKGINSREGNGAYSPKMFFPF